MLIRVFLRNLTLSLTHADARASLKIVAKW